MEIRILGPLEVTDGTGPLELGGPHQRALLARLAVASNRAVAIDVLIDNLWGLQPPGGAKQALQAHVSRIRKALGDAGRLVARPPGYLLHLGADELDAARFETLLGRARAAVGEGDLDAATRLWAQAEECWRGPALAEFGDYPFAQAEAARLSELRLGAIEARVEVELELGHHGELVAELEALVGEHPYRERLWAHLMLALYRGGRQADTLAAYQRVRAVLGAELGLAPSIELVRLEEAVLLQKPELAWVPPPAAVAPSASPWPAPAAEPPNNLPRTRSSFVGRQGDLDELEKLLGIPSLLTVVGPGGVGKTRLAVELARRLVGRFSGGVWLVELGSLRDHDLVPHAVAAALGVTEERDRSLLETLTAALAARRTLLLLDNCEHLIEAAAALADALLAAAGDLTVVATSREALRVEGEVVWRIPSLPVPAHDEASPEAALRFDAVRLFCERAEAHSGFALDAANTPAVAELCRRLDGIPLALELAAARSGALGPADMLARLEDRFALLTQGRRTALPRHQTLRAAIDWSYDLLSPAEQTLFRRLSVFPDRFTMEGAQVLAQDALVPSAVADLIANLVDKSLVEVDDTDGGIRYRLLESLSAFGMERLRQASEEAAVRTRHLQLYMQRAEGLAAQVRGDHAVSALQRLDEEQADVRAALEWSLQHDSGAALRLVAALACYWLVRGHLLEAQNACARALAADRDSSLEARAAALCAAGHVSCAIGRFDEALNSLDEAGALGRTLSDGVTCAEALDGLAWVAFEQGRYEAAQRLNEESLAIWNHSGADHGCVGTAAQVLHNLGILAFERGEFPEARAWFQKSLAASEKVGPIDRVAPLYGLGKVARAEGRLELATQMFTKSAAEAERVGFPRWVAFSRLFLASIALRQGELELSDSHLRDAMALSARLGDKICLAWCLDTLSGIAASRAEFRRAARLLGAAESLRESIGAPVQPSEREEYDAMVARIAAGLTKEEFVREQSKGRHLSLAQVLDLENRWESNEAMMAHSPSGT